MESSFSSPGSFLRVSRIPKLCWSLGTSFGLLVSPTVFADFIIPAAGQVVQAALGHGYNSSEQRFKGNCLDGSPENFVFIGHQTGSVVWSQAMDSASTKESLGFGVKARAKYGMISASAAADFATATSSDQYSESATYRADFRPKSIQLQRKVFTEQANRKKRSASAFREMCGDEYVEQVSLGGSLYVNLKIQFGTREEREAFSSQVKVSGPIGSVSASLKKASEKLSKSGFISIRLLQIGGDVEQLATIFRQTVPTGSGNVAPTLSSPLALVNCSMDQLESCTAVLESAIRYASEDFPSQITRNIEQVYSPGGPAFIHYVTKPWATAGVIMPNPIASQATVFAQQRLSDLFEREDTVMARIRSLDLARIRLSPAQREKLNRAERTVNANVHLIKEAANECYDDESTCVSVVRVLEQEPGSPGAIVPQSLVDFEILPETFAQFCDLTADPKHSAKLGNTVRKLLEVAARESNDGSLQGAVDVCGTAERLLLRLTRLELPFASLVDLRPVGTLPNLRSLRLNANQIEDLSPLGALKSLQSLNLNGNPASDFSILRELPNLQGVQLHNTQTLGAERYLRNLLPRVKLAFTEDEVCEAERSALLEARRIQPSNYQTYRQENLAPSYSDPRNPSFGINSWLPCATVSYFL
jgi:hypothetical protein